MSDQKEYKTPLLMKIGIKPDSKIALINAPAWLVQKLSDDKFLYDQIMLKDKLYNTIWVFENTIKGCESYLKRSAKCIEKNGMIWFSWYKKASKLGTELNENIIRDTALALDLVDVKVASVDDIWSALKMVIPLSNR
ncbi:MAG: DUF3052 domain-containing protein [Saprospiraceae bacterium]